MRDPGRSSRVAEPEDGSPRRLPSLSSDHPPAAPHMMSATSWCRDQTLACRNYPTLAPEENRVYPSNSRHRVATPYSPDAIGTFQDCYPIRNFTKRPSLDCSWSGFRYRVSFARLSRSLALSVKRLYVAPTPANGRLWMDLAERRQRMASRGCSQAKDGS
jgi:hypothetical protein